MNDDAPILQPLERLVEIPRGAREVEIPLGLLHKLDLTRLTRTVECELEGNPRARISFWRTSDPARIVCTVRIKTAYTDWPEEEEFSEVYVKCLAIAVRQLARREDDGDRFLHAYGNAMGGDIVFLHSFPLPIDGGGVIDAVHRELEAIRHRVNQILSVIANGPQPGTTALRGE